MPPFPLQYQHCIMVNCNLAAVFFAPKLVDFCSTWGVMQAKGNLTALGNEPFGRWGTLRLDDGAAKLPRLEEAVTVGVSDSD
jgi:hypothetical protein